MSDTLRERGAELFCGGKEPCAACLTDADATIALVLEEAAKACEEIYNGEPYAAHDWPTPEECAAAIRALGKP